METEEKPLVDELKKLYKTKKKAIQKRLSDFGKIDTEPENVLFAELCFCLCTPQTKAKFAWFNAIHPLMERGGLQTYTESELADFLRNTGVRFHHTKAKRIIQARELFRAGGIKELLNSYDNSTDLRDFLEDAVKGFGLKEASHFIRNIGRGNDLAILDRHILKNLVSLGVIDKMPKNLTKRRYLEIEEEMRTFSNEIQIPLAELDLLLWFKETGEIFK